jgi:4,4'-diaponeurosporenoate glycosyltransferase
MTTATILILLALGLWLAGWLVLGRIKPCGVNPFTPLADRKLSIIIPARNEAHNLPNLLRSLASQSVTADEIIVVDDASTDGTGEIARQIGVRVIQSLPLPDGWRGKTWACHQGAQAASGDWLLFLDADTWFEPDGLRRVLLEFQGAGGGALSVAPYHQVPRVHEQFSAFFNLVMLAGTGAFSLAGDHLQPRGLLGQFLLIERAAYEKVGGHEAVKGRILENFWLAEKLRALGVSLRCRSGDGVFAFRMYPHGWREMIEGWTKGFASGAGQTPLPILLLVILWMIGLMLPLVGLAFTSEPLQWLAVYLLGVMQVGWMLGRVGSFSWLTALFYPAPLIFYFVVFTRSLRRARGKQAVTWKGREIRAD